MAQNPQVAWHQALMSVAEATRKYVEDHAANGEPSGKMVIHSFQQGAGRFASGIPIGHVKIGGEEYEVRSKEVCSLHPVKRDTPKTTKGSAFG